MSDVARRLRGERQVAARGNLSLDREQAREKLRKFRLPDPHFYVLQFVRAASVLGAKHILFEFGAGDMTCTFDPSLPTERFDDFWSVAFDPRDSAEDAAMHNLALGVGSAQALWPREIRIRSGGREIVFTGDGESLGTCASRPGTEISMKEKFRFGHLLDYFTEHAEAKALRHYCRHATMLVYVDGEAVRATEGEFRTVFRANLLATNRTPGRDHSPA